MRFEEEKGGVSATSKWQNFFMGPKKYQEIFALYFSGKSSEGPTGPCQGPFREHWGPLTPVPGSRKKKDKRFFFFFFFVYEIVLCNKRIAQLCGGSYIQVFEVILGDMIRSLFHRGAGEICWALACFDDLIEVRFLHPIWVFFVA